MIPHVTRGGNTVGLIAYLLGPGRANEHTNQHIIAGTEDIAGEWAYGGRELTHQEALSVGYLLDLDRMEHGTEMVGKREQWDYDKKEMINIGEGPNHVFHVSLSLSPDEEALDDETWSKIAHDYVAEMGLIDTEDANCRWVAVRHGETKNGGDHIHVAINLVREDGRPAQVPWYKVHSQQVANVLEHRYGLEVLESREHNRGSIGYTPAEQEKAKRQGERFTERERLEIHIRAAMAAASTESEFITELRAQDVLVRPRYAPGTRDYVEGYSVALHASDGEKPTWFGGGRIARDLTLTRLRYGWTDMQSERAAALPLWAEGHIMNRPPRYNRRPSSQWQADEMQAWRDVSAAVDDTLAQLDALQPGDDEGLALCARQASSMFATLAGTHGKHGWRMSQAARNLGYLAQTKSSPQRRTPYAPPRFRSAISAMRRPGGKGGAWQSASLVRDMSRLSTSLADTYELHGQLVTARRTRVEFDAALASLTVPSTVAEPETRQSSGDLSAEKMQEIFGVLGPVTFNRPDGQPQAAKPTLKPPIGPTRRPPTR